MGYGDDLMVTAEARELKEKYRDSEIVVGDGEKEFWSPLFENNPNITRLQNVIDKSKVIWLRNHYGARPYLDYERSDVDRKVYFKPYRVQAGDIYFSETVLSVAKEHLARMRSSNKPAVFIEPNVAYGPTKDWGFKKYQQVVDILSDSVDFVQPLYAGAKELENVIGVQSDSFMQGCAFQSLCDMHLGPEGGLHHSAAALGLPAVVIFGGRMHPSITGYSFHNNIYIDHEDSPCGMISYCRHCVECMNQIKVEDIVNALLSQIEK